MTWCEHCRDHFPEDHYPDGNHAVGIQYGPTGVSMVAERLLHKILTDCEWVDFPREDYLCLDGGVEITTEEKAWLQAFLEEQGDD